MSRAATEVREHQIDAFATPGVLLKQARVAQGFSEHEAATRLKLLPGYVGMLERDDFQSLRSPAFARGYVRSYGRLLGLDEAYLMAVFDQTQPELAEAPVRRVVTEPLQLQRTGAGVAVGLVILVLLVAALWWWRADDTVMSVPPSSLEAAVSEPGKVVFPLEREG